MLNYGNMLGLLCISSFFTLVKDYHLIWCYSIQTFDQGGLVQGLIKWNIQLSRDLFWEDEMTSNVTENHTHLGGKLVEAM